MKKKLLITSIFILVLNLNAFSQKLYSIGQVKNTLIKYPNAFEAFSKLEIYKIPIDLFRQDTFLVNKSYDLLDKKYSLQLSYRNYKNSEIKNINKFDQDKKTYVRNFIKETKSYSNKQFNLFLDSIIKNDDLFKIYLDSAENYQFKLDSLDFLSYEKWQLDAKYIYFHSKLMTQRSYDTIRAYYDHYYQNSLNFNIPVLRALIDMGDPEVIAKYDSVFNEKIKKRTFYWKDYTQLQYFDVPFMYRMYARLIYYNKIDAGFQINAFIASYNFPVIYYKERDSSIIEINNFYQDKKGNYRCKFVVPLDVIAKYYTDFADYWEMREDYPKLNYKIK